MRRLNKFKLAEINDNELKAIQGGFIHIGPYIVGYIISEILEGIQTGLSTDCDLVPCCRN